LLQSQQQVPQAALAGAVATKDHRQRCQSNITRISPGFEILDAGFGQHIGFLAFANNVLVDIFHQRLRQQRLLSAGGGEALAQVGAQGAQVGYVGDDAGLFGEGWQGNNEIPRHSLR